MSDCVCGSGSTYEKCCQPYLEKNIPAPTAEALMRSRYTAYTKADMRYIEDTHHLSTRQQLDMAATEKWARSAEWFKLEVLSVKNGQPGEEKGVVEFKAYYRLDGKDCVLHEVSDFVSSNGRWYYVDGRLPDVKQYIRDGAKTGRNDPCPCGSGKKYKKCCGAN